MAKVTLPNNWKPRHYQLPVLKYLENGGKLAELVWHRRSGKDEVCLHRTACAAFERVANYWHMLPVAEQARKAIWEAVNPHTGKRRIDEAFPLALRRRTRNDTMMIEFVNGSSWQVVGSDNFDSLVGSTPAGVVYSEWALSNPAARAYLRPIFRENGGWQIFVGTPRGKNHAYTTYKAAESAPGSFAQILTATDTGVFSKEALDEELAAFVAEFGQEVGASLFDQEYFCSFESAVIGAVLGRWIARARQSGRMAGSEVFDPDGAPVCISSDLGFRDTSSWWFWQPRRDGFGLVGYIGESGHDADEWIEKLREYLENRNMRLGYIWLPHDARNKTFATKHSPLERFLAAFGAEHVRMVPQTKVSDRINAARRVIERCWFDEAGCEAGIGGLTAWRYEYDDQLKIMGKEPKHDWASHPGDAFSYGAQMMEMEPPPPEEAPKPRFLHDMTADEIFWPAPTRSRERY